MLGNVIRKIIPIKQIPVEETHSCKSEVQLHTEAREGVSDFLKGSFCVSMCPRELTLPKDKVREILLRNGFTIKEGQTDLKDYVYMAAEELIRETIKFKG